MDGLAPPDASLAVLLENIEERFYKKCLEFADLVLAEEIVPQTALERHLTLIERRKNSPEWQRRFEYRARHLTCPKRLLVMLWGFDLSNAHLWIDRESHQMFTRLLARSAGEP